MARSAAHLEQLNVADQSTFVGALGGVFENAPWVAERAFAARPFATVADLHSAMMRAVATAGKVERLGLIGGHPELGSKVTRVGAMTAELRREQGSLGSTA